MSNATQDGDRQEKNNATSSTRFGSSVESKAQIADAETIASGTSEGEILNIYRLVPTAPATDERWRNVEPPGEVVVAARTSGDARIVAAGRELDFMDIDAVPAEGVTTSNASLFRDEKAYTVIQVEQGRSGLRRGVVEGYVSTDTIKPTQV